MAHYTDLKMLLSVALDEVPSSMAAPQLNFVLMRSVGVRDIATFLRYHVTKFAKLYVIMCY